MTKDILKRINLILKEDTDINTSVKLIKKNCDKFLKESNKLPLYRGIKKSFEFAKFEVRKDRRPKDMKPSLHDAINKEFEKIHGIKNVRSVSLFVFGDTTEIFTYGNTYIVFPIGNYTYWWNPQVLDLWRELKEEGIREYNDIGRLHKEYYFEDLLKSYTNKDLPKAINSINEIMFQCDYYYAVSPEVYEKIKELIYDY